MSWLTRLITSCFLPCKDDHETISSPNMIVRNTTFDKREDENFNNIHNNNLSQSSTTCNNIHLNDDSSWSFFSDEDFIVYCFEKDGPFDIVKDDKGVHKYARPVLLKPKYDQNAIVFSEFDIHNKRSNVNQCDKISNVNQCDIDQLDQDSITLSKEGEDEEEEIKHNYKDNKPTEYQVEVNEDYEMVSFEPRNSIQCGDSTRSFAFPVLDCEWIGSPEPMPKSEGRQHLKKKHKAKYVRFPRFSWIKRCSLGDINITNNGACYGKAVEVSDKRTAPRAKFNNTKRSGKPNMLISSVNEDW